MATAALAIASACPRDTVIEIRMSEPRAGGALFSPRVRPARRRADPVARRHPQTGSDVPLTNGQRLKLTIHPPTGRNRAARFRWKGRQEDLDYLILPDDNGLMESP